MHLQGSLQPHRLICTGSQDGYNIQLSGTGRHIVHLEALTSSSAESSYLSREAACRSVQATTCRVNKVPVKTFEVFIAKELNQMGRAQCGEIKTEGSGVLVIR